MLMADFSFMSLRMVEVFENGDTHFQNPLQRSLMPLSSPAHALK